MGGTASLRFYRWNLALSVRNIGYLYRWLLLTYYFMNRRYRNLLICLFSILLLGTYHSTLYWLDRPRTSLVFYNVRGCPAVHCIESDGRSWINYVDTISNEKTSEAHGC